MFKQYFSKYNPYFSFVIAILQCICFKSFAQTEKIDTTVFNQIRNAEFKSSQIEKIAHYLTDVSGSRLTNSPGFFRAARWANETLKKWGLSDAALEPWGEYGRGWDVQDFGISMKAPYNGFILGYPLSWSSSTNGEIQGVVYTIQMRDLLDSNFLNRHRNDIRGKIILIPAGGSKHEVDSSSNHLKYTNSELLKMPDSDMLSAEEWTGFMKFINQLVAAQKKLTEDGALAVILASSGGRDGTVFVQGIAGYKLKSPDLIPIAKISSEDSWKIDRLMASGIEVKLALNIKARFYDEDTKGYNVIANYPGSDPLLKEQVVMIGGHLDSWSAATGATDNAAGCAVMMEAVRLLDSLKLRPRRTIRIALWSAEEVGSIGSYKYVLNHIGNAETGIMKKDFKNVSAYFNLDNGTGKIRGIYAQGNKTVVPIFKQWLSSFNDLDATTVTLSNTGSTDHIAFDWAGIPAFEFIQDPLDYESRTHHSNMDTYDYLDFDALKQASIIVACFIYQAAMRDELLPRKPLVKQKYAYEIP